MSYEEDMVDVNLDEIAQETAQEVAVQSEELAEGLEKTLVDTDGDPCNSHQWSIIFLLLFVLAYLVMILHLISLFKRRSNLSAFDILSIALFVSSLIQFGPMLSQVMRKISKKNDFFASGRSI